MAGYIYKIFRQMNRKKLLSYIFAIICMLVITMSESCHFTIDALADEGDYLIKVNMAKDCITIYEKGGTGEYTVPVKSMACAVFEGEITGEVNYSIISKTEWKRMADNTYSHYVIQIDRNIHICSSSYAAQSNDSLDKDKYNIIGEGKTNQNICVNVADAKWLYEHCAKGATVQLYSNDANDGPLGKPDTIHLGETAEYPNWDPTDDNENNPWLGKSARIEGVKDLEIDEGEEINLLEEVKGYDVCGNDISDKIIIMGTYDLNKEGQYMITYYLKDATGSQISQTSNLTVNKGEQETTTKVIESSSESDTTVVVEEQESRGDKISALIGIAIIAFGMAAIIIKRSNSV